MRLRELLATTKDPSFRAGHRLAASMRVADLEVLVALCTQDMGLGYMIKLGHWARRLVDVGTLPDTRVQK